MKKKEKSVELFTGAGGLALGVSKAGFDHDAVVEWDHDACETIRENQRRGINPVAHWPLFQVDISRFDFSPFGEDIGLLAGGPPCQPFSLGGKHRGNTDPRNMFPDVIRAIRALRPRAIMIENVKGLLRSAFAKYFEYIILQITYPEIIRKNNESWIDHLSKLEKQHTGGAYKGLSYKVVYRLLNAADYGVPQKRERVFIVGFRSDLDVNWSFPNPTHSADALIWDQWVSGEYWDRHGVSKKARPAIPQKVMERASFLRSWLYKPSSHPWSTVRDAISDLPDPEKNSNDTTILNHRFNPGARSYPGHTGSFFDEPAKTLKAGDHGVPGGENMVCYPNGRLRYFTVRESARLQTFDDGYYFRGAWSEAMRQLGNAVPVKLSEAVARKIHGVIRQDKGSRNSH